MADKPTKGLADVVAASTALSDIDGKAGRLFYRGYDIHDLAGRATFEETAHLLQRGKLPTRSQLDAYGDELARGRELGALVSANIAEIAEKQKPMEALRTLVSLAGADDADKDSIDPEANLRKAARLVAQQPLLVARYHAARTGSEALEPDPSLSIAANFLLQVTGRTPDRREVEIFDECLVLHADHTMNASTFAARVCAATLSDMHSAIVAAIGTLKGPLHGGANEQVMKTLESLSPGGVAQAVRDKLAAGEKIMGFGHRVYKTEDPPRHAPAPHVRRARRGRRRRHVLPDVEGDGGGRLRDQGPLSQRRFLRRFRLPLPWHSDRPVHAGLLRQPHVRLDGSRDRAARRQPADPPRQ
ncbi:hypothetical protein GCM10020001_058890 [Nonomuraea salmonea]